MRNETKTRGLFVFHDVENPSYTVKCMEIKKEMLYKFGAVFLVV
jgi:hypothetical protein